MATTASITGIDRRPSKFGGDFYYIYFKDVESGKSLRTCVYPNYRNYRNWANIIKQYEDDKSQQITLTNLIVRNGTMVDADSVPQIVMGSEGDVKPRTQ